MQSICVWVSASDCVCVFVRLIELRQRKQKKKKQTSTGKDRAKDSSTFQKRITCFGNKRK